MSGGATPGAAGSAVRRIARWTALLAALCVGAPSVAAQAGGGDDSEGRGVFVDELGCAGCHGTSGEGGLGPALAETDLPLATFVKQIRLPEGVMPPFAPLLATDAQLLTVYRWLGGSQPVGVPAVNLTLEGTESFASGEPGAVEIGATAVEDAGTGLEPDAALRIRITLLRLDTTPEAGRALEFRRPGGAEWTSAETDEEGRLTIGSNDPIPAATLLGEGGADPLALRLALPSGQYALVAEALPAEDGGDGPAVGLVARALEVP